MLMSIAWSAPSAIMTGGMGFGGQVGKVKKKREEGKR
jgi:lipid-binding SYLF domain-containing protein